MIVEPTKLGGAGRRAREQVPELPGEGSLAALLAAGGIAVVVVRTLLSGGYFSDDTWITFRFAENLANGAGLVWNVGGERVEGFTSPLHVWLLAFGRLIGVPVVAGSYVVSFVALFGIVAVFHRVVKRVAGRFSLEAALLLAIYLVTSHLTVHVAGGLDTLLSMVLLACSFLTSLRLVSSPTRGNAALLAGVNLLTLLGRPDTAPYLMGQGAVLLGHAVVRWWKDADRRPLQATLQSFALLTLVGALYLAWKQSYFGYLLPNSFYVKVASQESFAGAEHVKRFCRHLGFRYFLWVLPLFLFVAPGRLLDRWRRREAPVGIALLLAPPAAFMLFYTTALHAVCFDFRFEYPMALFACLTSALLLAVGAPFARLHRLLARYLPPALSVALIGLAAFAVPTWLVLRHPMDKFTIFRIFREMQVGHYEPIAVALRQSGAGVRGTIVFDSAGFIPYASGFSHIDPIGLTDNTLSGREPITPLERERYIWGRRPDVYLGPVPPASEGTRSADEDQRIDSRYVQKVLLGNIVFSEYRRIYSALSQQERRDLLHVRMRELRDNWVMVGEVPYPHPSPKEYTHFLFVRRDSPFAAELIREIDPLVRRRLADFDFENPAMDPGL